MKLFYFQLFLIISLLLSTNDNELIDTALTTWRTKCGCWIMEWQMTMFISSIPCYWLRSLSNMMCNLFNIHILMRIMVSEGSPGLLNLKKIYFFNIKLFGWLFFFCNLWWLFNLSIRKKRLKSSSTRKTSSTLSIVLNHNSINSA